MYFTVKVKLPTLIVEYLAFGQSSFEILDKAMQRFNTTQIRILRGESK